MIIRFKRALDSSLGLRFIYNNLRLSSSLAKVLLLESKFKYNAKEIQLQYDELSEFLTLLSNNHDFAKVNKKIDLYLEGLRDIRNSLKRISEGAVADDIELFEIKSLILTNQRIKPLIDKFEINSVTLEDLSDLNALLDPEGAGINSFYIYDSYSTELKEVRQLIRKGGEYNEELLYRSALIENQVRERLSDSLKSNYNSLVSSINNLAKLDILIAKAKQVVELNLTIPTIGEGITTFSRLVNPEILSLLKEQKLEYQPVDIEFSNQKPLLITGSNMGGKSVTLKSVALSQYLFHFGFGIPAEKAVITPVKEILVAAGDNEDYKLGLSSFAAEIKLIDSILQKIKDKESYLVLIDEPARSTNPYEGAALASALLSLLNTKKDFVILTSHYTLHNLECDRVRVKGYREGKMDYSLIKEESSAVPTEALSIAESLGADPEWLRLAKEIIETKQ